MLNFLKSTSVALLRRYQSSISLKNLYPESTLKLITPTPPSNLNEKFTGYIPLNELEITYTKSSGPGGQNVNKINSKVEIRFHIEQAAWLNNKIKNNLQERLKNKITKEGYLIFRSDITRSQQLKLADCLEKIRNVIWSCDIEEKKANVESIEKMRRRMEKAARERLAIKRERSNTKDQRRSFDFFIS